MFRTHKEKKASIQRVNTGYDWNHLETVIFHIF